MAENDAIKAMGPRWEQFEFNIDVPLDDEEIEAGEDDASLVECMSHGFRFFAVEARMGSKPQPMYCIKQWKLLLSKTVREKERNGKKRTTHIHCVTVFHLRRLG
ncbi:hypothetical protein U1Q18_040661, partial [Sarracenia purpurea var. burkii]